MAQVARRAQYYGVYTGPVSVDIAATMARVNKIREGGRAGLEHLLTSMKNVTLLRGWARFVGPRILGRENDDVATAGDALAVVLAGLKPLD